MRLPTLRAWPPVLPAGEDTYQEFVAGTIPVTRLVTDSNEVLVLVEHEWGILHGFDEYLDAIREPERPPGRAGYTVTWTGMAGGEPRETLIRLELRIDGLRARPRLLFHDIATPPLWTLTRTAILGLYVDRDGLNPESPLDDVWLIGRNPARADLRRVLTQVGVPRPVAPARRPSRRPLRRGRERARTHKRPRRRTIEKPN
jgi:hypothetical protein